MECCSKASPTRPLAGPRFVGGGDAPAVIPLVVFSPLALQATQVLVRAGETGDRLFVPQAVEQGVCEEASSISIGGAVQEALVETVGHHLRSFQSARHLRGHVARR